VNLKPRRPEEPEINVISLIDVVLLLVVFFMLSSNFSTEGRLRIRLPQANDKSADRAAGEGLTVSISASGAYLVNGRELVNSSTDTLRAAILKSTTAATRNAPVTIRADGRASHQAVVTAMDVLAHLGFSQMNVATLNETAAGSP